MSAIEALLTDPAWRRVFVDIVLDELNAKSVKAELGKDRYGNRLFLLDYDIVKKVGDRYFRVEYRPTTPPAAASGSGAAPSVSS